jgi:glycosyltransferase involved in cell wall biosynthesis
MKILSVHISTPNEYAAWWRILNIVKILRAGGHDVDVVHYVRKALYEELKDKEKYAQDSFVIISTPTVHLKHLKVLRNGDYDLVYGNEHSGAFCSILGRLIKTPLIFDMHGDLIEESILMNNATMGRLSLNRSIDFMDLKFSSKIICVSKKMIEYLHDQKGVPFEKMAYVTNGVDLEFFKHVDYEKSVILKNKLGLADKLIFGYVGDFQKWQGVEKIISSAKKIGDDKDLAFLIVGGKRELRQNNTLFIPKIPRAQVPDYYSVCDVLVLPRPSYLTAEIAAPTKFAEYSAMGKPILTTNVGDAADFVREYNCGIVVEDNAPTSLMRGIKEFRSKSIEELKEMGINSRKLAENEFDWRKVGDKLLRVVDTFR